MCKYLIEPAVDAICAGDWVLAEHILKRWQKPLTLRGEVAPWQNVPATRVWLALLQGDDEQACFLIKTLDEDCEIFHMLLNRDRKGLEREIIGNIRSLRGRYDLYTEGLSPYNLALWKLAHRRGIELNLPSVSEMPVALMEDKALDAKKWKLPGQAVLDEALGPQGMELLAKWTQLYENSADFK